jgi:hypothetical protein
MRRSGHLLMVMILGAALYTPGASATQSVQRLDSLRDLFNQLGRCWRSPPLPNGDKGEQITVLVAFNRNGEILGRPRITYESEAASDDDHLIYRTAVMATLLRCTPLQLTDGLARALAGRPITFRIDDRRRSPSASQKAA